MSPRHVAATLALLWVPGVAGAQVRHRRPMAPAPDVRYGFDNNSGSGCRDYNCGSRCYDGHSGTDFPVPVGTQVLASADGTVSGTNDGCADFGGLGNTCGGRCGNYVQLQHADGRRTIFCHMQRGSLAVTRGQRVRCGQAIGRSASSGSSTGPHLHFGLTRSGASIDSYRGRCTSSPGGWTDQRAYPQSPAATCQCVPSTEVCNGRDDDCDGRVDESLSRSCYTGPAGTSGRGACRAGSQTCGSGRWGSCSGQVVPRTETCNRADDDCDGRVDDGVCAMDAGPPRDAAADVAVDRADARPAMDVRDATDEVADDVADELADDVTEEPADDAEVADDATDDAADDVAEDAEFDDVPPPKPDGSEVAPDDGRSELDGGCGCRAGAPRSTGAAWAWAAIALAMLRRGRKRR